MIEELKMKNYTKVLVADAIQKVWNETEDICKCKRCYYYTMALSLNHLPAKYVVTQSGEAYAKIDSLITQKIVDVMTAVVKASAVVNGNYSHSAEEIVTTNSWI